MCRFSPISDLGRGSASGAGGMVRASPINRGACLLFSDVDGHAGFRIRAIRRGVGCLVVAAGLIGTLSLTVARFGDPTSSRIIQLVALTPFGLIPALVLLCVALVAGNWGPRQNSSGGMRACNRGSGRYRPASLLDRAALRRRFSIRIVGPRPHRPDAEP